MYFRTEEKSGREGPRPPPQPRSQDSPWSVAAQKGLWGLDTPLGESYMVCFRTSEVTSSSVFPKKSSANLPYHSATGGWDLIRALQELPRSVLRLARSKRPHFVYMAAATD